MGVYPAIFRGIDIIAFLRERNRARKQPCGPGRLFCFRCKAPKRPAFSDGRILARWTEARQASGSLPGLHDDNE